MNSKTKKMITKDFKKYIKSLGTQTKQHKTSPDASGVRMSVIAVILRDWPNPSEFSTSWPEGNKQSLTHLMVSSSNKQHVSQRWGKFQKPIRDTYMSGQLPHSCRPATLQKPGRWLYKSYWRLVFQWVWYNAVPGLKNLPNAFCRLRENCMGSVHKQMKTPSNHR